MKNSITIIIGPLLIFAFGMQVFMLYRIDRKLDQRFAQEKILNLSTHQGSDAWIQNPDNWNPYDELLQMRNQMERIINESISRFKKNSTAASVARIPVFDISNEKDRYVVKADVPGAKESSLNVALNGRQLTISIKTESVNEQGGNNNNHREQFSGEFQRSITLPGDVDKDAMKTEYSDGVLTIIIPKA